MGDQMFSCHYSCQLGTLRVCDGLINAQSFLTTCLVYYQHLCSPRRIRRFDHTVSSKRWIWDFIKCESSWLCTRDFADISLQSGVRNSKILRGFDFAAATPSTNLGHQVQISATPSTTSELSLCFQCQFLSVEEQVVFVLLSFVL